MLVVTCACGQRMKAPPEYLGKKCRCVGCGKSLKITEENARPVEEESPANGADQLPAGAQGQPDRLAELLLENHLIDQQKLDQALAHQTANGGKLFDAFLALELVTEDALHELLSRQSGVAAVDLQNCDIPKDIVALVPREFAHEHHVFPIDRFGKLLTVGMACPLDDAAIAELAQLTGLRVKPMLCSLGEINVAITQRYDAAPVPSVSASGQVVPSPDETRDRLVRLDSLPTYSDIVERVRKAVERPESTLRDLAEIVRTDPAVAAKLLGVANAAAYGMPGRVNSIDLASTVLGIDGICEIVMSSKIESAAHASLPLDHAAFSNNARFCGAAAKAIAQRCQGIDAACAYTTGLLHGIGRLALAETYPDKYREIGKELADGALADAETELTGMNHAEAGHALALAWGIPNDVAEAIRDHLAARAGESQGGMTAVVALAAYMAAAAQNGQDAGADAFQEYGTLLTALGLDPESASNVLTEVASTCTPEAT